MITSSIKLVFRTMSFLNLTKKIISIKLNNQNLALYKCKCFLLCIFMQFKIVFAFVLKLCIPCK